ncbi:MAG: hypothetical protein NCW75_13840 [Phycisphaera sp.]|nr:MAG: hypothetical protein NCW75_13840 [Phycisphaera sp.]
MAGHNAVAQSRRSHETQYGTWEEGIEGSFRSISAHQLCMAWWLHVDGHITRKQLRVYFAAHEMAERRRAASASMRNKTRPLYTIEEVADIIGGRGTKSALAELRADVRQLKALGLVAIESHEIGFASSIKQIDIEDASSFGAMYERVPNGRRTVPVPRRTLRALAAGLSRGVTGVMLATLIRSLFWHKSSGTYRVDGRTKGSWITEVFGISRRAVTDARATLIELGWLEPCETPQWALNRWGAHDKINTDWCPGDATQAKTTSNDNQQTGKSASPRSEFSGGSASPNLTDSLPLKGNQETRRLRHARSRSGVETDPSEGGGSARVVKQRHYKRRSSKQPRKRSRAKPNIRDIQSIDLASIDRLLDLHGQATKFGLWPAGEAARLDFVALAERARARGRRAGAMFYWLLRERKTVFITQHDEDRAARRIKAHLHGPLRETRSEDPPSQGHGARSEDLGRDELFVVACVRVAKQQRIDPADIARKAKGWTRQVWDEAYDAFQRAQFERQNPMAGNPAT